MKALNDSLPTGAQLEKVVQLRMDRPVVNLKLFSLVQEDLSDKDKKLLDVGSCSLHVIHNAFKVFLSIQYRNSSDPATTPSRTLARRAEFIKVTGTLTFPMKFVGIHWLENGVVAARAIAILSSLEKFVNAVKPKEIKTTTFKSLSTLIQSFENLPLLRARLEFFSLIATELVSFLREFQSNALLAPMLYERLQVLLRKLMKRFVESNVLKGARTGKELVKIDLEKNSNLRSLFEVDIGFGAKRALHGSSQTNESQ